MFLEYDQLILLFMCFMALLSRTLERSSICVLIPLSYIPYFINDYSFHGTAYYIAEGVRHLSVILSLYILWALEGYYNNHGRLYLCYLLFYLNVIIHYLLGLFVVLDDNDLNHLSLPLNTIEVVIFMYGFFTNNKNNNIDLSDS